MSSRTPTLDYLTEARRRGSTGYYAVSPIDCRCEICQQREQRYTIHLDDGAMLEVIL